MAVILDTATPLLTVTCVGCTSCTPTHNPPFDPLASAGCVAAPCASPAFPSGCNSRQQAQFNLSYTDGSSLLGVVYEDVVWVGDSPGSSFPFGCTTVERNAFVNQTVDGVLGLSPGNTSLPSALYYTQRVSQHLFSLCPGPEGGTLTMGGMSSGLRTGPVGWTPLQPSSPLGHAYSVAVGGATVAGAGLQGIANLNAGGGLVVDSGTPFLLLPDDMYASLVAAFDIFCAGGIGRCNGTDTLVPGETHCYVVQGDGLATFPSLSLALQGATGSGAPTLSLPLLLPMHWYLGAHCLPVYPSGGSGGVLGVSAMLDMEVVFDVEGARVGFAPAHCGPSPSPSSTGTFTSTSTPRRTASRSRSLSSTPPASATGTGRRSSTGSRSRAQSRSHSRSITRTHTRSKTRSRTPSRTPSTKNV